MPRRARDAVAWFGKKLPALLTLAALAGVAVVGAHYDWALPPALGPGGEAETTDRESPEPATRVEAASEPGAAAGPRRVVFRSAEAARKAGIRVVPAEVRDLAQYVTANGVV